MWKIQQDCFLTPCKKHAHLLRLLCFKCCARCQSFTLRLKLTLSLNRMSVFFGGMPLSPKTNAILILRSTLAKCALKAQLTILCQQHLKLRLFSQYKVVITNFVTFCQDFKNTRLGSLRNEVWINRINKQSSFAAEMYIKTALNHQMCSFGMAMSKFAHFHFCFWFLCIHSLSCSVSSLKFLSSKNNGG